MFGECGPVLVISAASVCAVGESADQQRHMKPLIHVCYCEDDLNIGVEAGLTQTLPVLLRLEAHLVHSWSEGVSADQAWTAAVLIRAPDGDEAPDGDAGLQTVQTEGHPLSRDPIAGVQHVCAQRTDV